MDHCQQCAEACFRCEQECRNMAERRLIERAEPDRTRPPSRPWIIRSMARSAATTTRPARRRAGGAITDVAGIEVGHFTDDAPAHRLQRGHRARWRGGRRRCARRRARHARNRPAGAHQRGRSRARASCWPAAAPGAWTPPTGVMRWLEEQGIGFPAGPVRVPHRARRGAVRPDGGRRVDPAGRGGRLPRLRAGVDPARRRKAMWAPAPARPWARSSAWSARCAAASAPHR